MSNPKDLIGRTKMYWSVLPWNVLARVSLVLLEGARKYGRHNWRTSPIEAGVYFDASLRHMTAWWEGEDYTPEGTYHIDNAIATLLILRDSVLRGDMIDDRPPRSEVGWTVDVNQAADKIVKQWPDAKEVATESSLLEEKQYCSLCKNWLDGESRLPCYDNVTGNQTRSDCPQIS